ncbi:plasmid segregation protein ParM [Orenia metallireducens]|jgi:plasmid segregation protein ParM|uniref:Plasmid segregation protein ParM n=1 Tax=Orenia metallireducens TaxID=1413210 RepID=A0A285IHI2_9FIRM|nr:ParM/StbA family protein [Orenia metallireducens]PRX17487.1 plasmid segregation protein ParM [Orenia metallireducens]SNY47424.1 plasmid segregation protein ParM [Orenia metallireducens]
MRTEKIRVIGVDLGYDSVKMMAKDKKIVFPSLVEEEEEGILLENSLEVLKNEELLEKFDINKIIIKIQDKIIRGYNDDSFNTYRVGNYVLNQRSSSIGYSLSDQKYKEPEEFAKLLSGISLLFPKADKIVIKNLVTGLPIKYYEKHKDYFKKELVNTFTIQIKNIKNQFISKEIEIKKATVIPQGLASYYDFIMDNSGLVTTNIEGGLGIIDLGGLTIDCVAFNDGELIKDSPISFNDGVRTRIFKKIQDSLDIDISQDLIKKQILAGKDFIRVRNERYEFKEIKDYSIDKLAKDIALQIKNRWESFLMIDKILITGGATILLFENVNKYLEDFPCERIDNEPQFSNCRGYIKLGKALDRKREEELKAKLKERTNQATEEVAATTNEG